MQFNKNKAEPFHRWYPFVEGYSKEFIESIIEEVGTKNLVCLEPFSGSGTTALELQNNNIECISFEVNPLMYLIARVKMENGYTVEKTKEWFSFISRERKRITKVDLDTSFKTLYENENIEKWNYNLEVALAIKKTQSAINMIDERIYRELFMVALASILLDVSNLYRNGKCLSYKKNWTEKKVTENQVFEKFDSKVKNEILEDIKNYLIVTNVSNKNRLYNLDSRVGISKQVKDDSIDLVITSPPYLNSRDYTDTYMLELKTLGLTINKEEIRKLREKTLRSHVQIKWQDQTLVNNKVLIKTLNDLKCASKKKKVWNDSIIDMIRLYFVDMENIFNVLYKKMKKGGKVYFNVSNSAYFDVLVNTLEICASIAENSGFVVKEIRKARLLKTSPQQKNTIKSLLEGVIVLEK